MTVNEPSISLNLGDGYYTVGEAAHILNVPSAKLRRWLGKAHAAESVFPLGEFTDWQAGRSKAFPFVTLIELFTIIQLREHGVSVKKLREGRAELARRLDSPYPFAHCNVVSSGRDLLARLEDDMHEAYLELGTNGQTAFSSVMSPFCRKLEFDVDSKLAERFWPRGKESCVVIDPHHNYGRPSIAGTNIGTETIASLLKAGESLAGVAAMFDLETRQVEEVRQFECSAA